MFTKITHSADPRGLTLFSGRGPQRPGERREPPAGHAQRAKLKKLAAAQYRQISVSLIMRFTG